MNTSTLKMRHCFNCGAELGRYREYDQFDTCGARDCDREARDAMAQERQDAHDALDESMGW